MKKVLLITLISFVWCNSLQAQEFYPNKELDMEKFINFDLTKYKFQDHKKIIGKNFRSWNGDPDRMNPSAKDWKQIDVKINGSDYTLQLTHLKSGGIDLYMLMQGVSCDSAKSIIPSKYIKEENSIEYTSDFNFAKIYINKFSFDTNLDTRLKFGCLAMLGSDGKGSDEDVSSTFRLASIKETDFSEIVALKMIRCEVLQYKNKYKLDSNSKRALNYNYKDMPNPVFLDFYISDGTKELLNKKFRDTGKTIRFDRDMIHTEKTYKLDKTKVDRKFTFEEYKIDRIYGDFYFNKREYNKKHVSLLTPNNEIELQYKGKCVKKDIEERAF